MVVGCAGVAILAPGPRTPFSSILASSFPSPPYLSFASVRADRELLPLIHLARWPCHQAVRLVPRWRLGRSQQPGGQVAVRWGQEGAGHPRRIVVDLVRVSRQAARSVGRRAWSRKCDPAQPTTIEVILCSHSWQAAQQHPMVLGCAAVAFFACGPVSCALGAPGCQTQV